MAQQTANDDRSEEPTGADPDGTTDVATGTVERNGDADENGEYQAGEILTVRVHDADLPADGETRERIEERLGSAVGSILQEDYGVAVGAVTTKIGHEYVQISDDCPWCDSMTEMHELTADTENGAYATAECTNNKCEFFGTAVYRLIDFERFSPEEGFEAAVAEGVCAPSYYGY